MDLDEIAAFAQAMVNTGDRVPFEKGPIFDFHSVGGVPGNKITPIVVSICAAAGLMLPKTSSRAISSACGTSDFVETFCNIEVTTDKLKEIGETVGGAFVWGGSMNLAPVDDIVIKIEHPLGINPRPQMLASILSKKLAINANYLLVDIPTGAGTKIPTIEVARAYARDFTDLGETDDNHTIAMNDKVVLWKGTKDALVVYDGKTTKVGGKWPGQLLAKVGGGISGREEFYFLGGKKLKMGKLKDGSIKDVQEIIPDLTATSPDFKNAQFFPVASDKDEIFVRSVLQKPGQNKKVPVLVAFDKKGKELRRYEGMEGSRKGFCVTDKYVIFIDPDGNFRVFEKKSGKKLGEGKLTFGVFALATVKGNSIIAYDESAKKLYRIDF